MSAPAVGIDLGTTFSCAAVYRNGRAEIITNAQGSRITPSVVSFGQDRLVGEPAKNLEASNPENTVFGVKRLIGRRWEDTTVQQDIEFWPFKVVNEDGRPKVVVTYRGSQRRFFPEEISAMVLGCMKTACEAYLGKTVTDAVVTVPAYFNDSQRQATKDAATIAGLSVLRIINEPTAAALAYGLGTPLEDERNVLIFDLGGGTFDVSVLCIEEGIFEVKSTAGDTHLGGEDIDNIITKHFAQEFHRRYGHDLTANKRAMLRLRKESERAKRMLSSATEVSIELDSLFMNLDFRATLTRARFEELCDGVFRRTLEPVRRALADAKLTIDEICEIVLVGGSTRIPKVQALLRNLFRGRRLTQTVNPDEAVAAGAAVQAAMLGDPATAVTDLVLLDVTPLSLGTQIHGNIMSVIIPRNTPIPVKNTQIYQTIEDNQPTVKFEIREGERLSSLDNNLLGEFSLTDIPRAPAGMVKFHTTFEIDANGILHASSIEPTRNIRNNVSIEKGRLSKNEIDRIMNVAKRFEQQDLVWKETVEAKNSLELFCRNLKSRLANNTNLTPTTRQLKKQCADTLRWVCDHPKATKDHYVRKLRDLKLICDMTNMTVSMEQLSMDGRADTQRTAPAREEIHKPIVTKGPTPEQLAAVRKVKQAVDDYQMFGVDKRTPPEAIKKAYRRLAALLHPDKNKAPGARDAFMIMRQSFDRIKTTQAI